MITLSAHLSPANERARKSAAAKVSLPMRDYDRHLAAGEKWCAGCCAWHEGSEAMFGICQSKWDGLNTFCKAWRALYDAVRRYEKTRAA